MKGTDALFQAMIKEGTDVVFGYPGGQVIPIFDSLIDYEDKIRNILVRHEQAAAHAADSYGRVSAKPGVCIATSGPGATNLVTGIMTAYMDSSPMIAIGGQVPTNVIGNDAFQESDMFGMTMPITKHSFQLRDANKIAETILKSYKIATEGRQGPVYVEIPRDIQLGDVTSEIPKQVKIRSFQPTINPNPIQIKKAVELLLKAERPLIIAGGGVISSNAKVSLHNLVQLLKAPVATTLMGKGSYDENDPFSLGMIGMHGKKIANYAVINCDVMLAVGCRFNDLCNRKLIIICRKLQSYPY